MTPLWPWRLLKNSSAHFLHVHPFKYDWHTIEKEFIWCFQYDFSGDTWWFAEIDFQIRKTPCFKPWLLFLTTTTEWVLLGWCLRIEQGQAGTRFRPPRALLRPKPYRELGGQTVGLTREGRWTPPRWAGRCDLTGEGWSLALPLPTPNFPQQREEKSEPIGKRPCTLGHWLTLFSIQLQKCGVSKKMLLFVCHV